MSKVKAESVNKATTAGFIIAMGIVYGDIGTSPLYTMQSLLEGQGGLEHISRVFVLGAISLIIWTLTLITTVKYVLVALRADNNNEGGIFSLYTLVRKNAKWLVVPAMIGGATLLADGALTPAVTVTSAVEGLRGIPAFYNEFGINQTPIVIITLVIIMILFLIQRFGTAIVGRLFGPVMFIWFSFIGLIGLVHLTSDWSILAAFNPYYALRLLFSPENKAGFFILGSVFLATTGAEALYSDLGHVGRGNIYISWPFVKVAILLSYMGQGAWLLKNQGATQFEGVNPFFAVVPHMIIIPAVILATLAAIIASQSLISGSFTLVSEAIRLKMLPMMRIMYPGKSIGQLYIPMVNYILLGTTSLIVLYFRTSAHMEAAYGLAITLTMLMTTLLLTYYLRQSGVNRYLVDLALIFFGLLEGSFFIASAVKFVHGGYVVVIIAMIIVFAMFIWVRSNTLMFKYVKKLNLNEYKQQLADLRADQSYDLYDHNLVYLTSRMDDEYIDRSIMYSILDRLPKRAYVYWFVHVNVTDEPYTNEYEVDLLDTDYIVRVNLYLGFRMEQNVSRYLRTIVKNLIESGRLPEQNRHYSISENRQIGGFRYVVIEERLTNNSRISTFDRFVLQTKTAIKRITATPIRWFGLQFFDVIVETAPLIPSEVHTLPINERE